jgi:hypothetical protein
MVDGVVVEMKLTKIEEHEESRMSLRLTKIVMFR